MTPMISQGPPNSKTLSPMEPAHEPVLAQIADVPTEAPEARPAATPQAHPSVDPPPPRFV